MSFEFGVVVSNVACDVLDKLVVLEFMKDACQGAQHLSL